MLSFLFVYCLVFLLVLLNQIQIEKIIEIELILFREAEKYLRKPDHVEAMKVCHETESFKQLARSLLVVASTPPTDSYEEFTAKVRQYNARKPFDFLVPSLFYHNKYLKVSTPTLTHKYIHALI